MGNKQPIYHEPNARCQRCGMGYHYASGAGDANKWFCGGCARWIRNWKLEALREMASAPDSHWDKSRIAAAKEALERAYWNIKLLTLEVAELDEVVDRLSAEKQGQGEAPKP
jgi:hypothetical protein